MSRQKRTIVMQLTEEEADAAMNAINTDREAAVDNPADDPDEREYANMLGSIQTKLGESWTDAHTMLSHAQQVMWDREWDAGGATSVHLPRAKAEDLLQRLGWALEEPQYPKSYTGPSQRIYVAPDRSTSTFDLDEALTLALVALSLGKA